MKRTILLFGLLLGIFLVGTSRVMAAEETVDPEVLQARMDAVEWAIRVADDDSFTYGEGRTAHRTGCYFCGTNWGPVQKKKAAGYERTYCCNPFLTAAFAHGARDAYSYSLCNRGASYGLTVSSWEKGPFEEVGPLTVEELEVGDIILWKGKHVAIYAGEGQMVEAHGDSLGGIEVDQAKVTKSYGGSTILRYIGGEKVSEEVAWANNSGYSGEELGLAVSDYEREYDGKTHHLKIRSNVEAPWIRYSVDRGKTWEREYSFRKVSESGKVWVMAYVPGYQLAVDKDVQVHVRRIAATVKVLNDQKGLGEDDPDFQWKVVKGKLPKSAVKKIQIQRISADVDKSIGVYPGVLKVTDWDIDPNYKVTFLPGDFEISLDSRRFSIQAEPVYKDGDPVDVKLIAKLNGQTTLPDLVYYSIDGGMTFSPMLPNLKRTDSLLIRAMKYGYAPTRVVVELNR